MSEGFHLFISFNYPKSVYSYMMAIPRTPRNKTRHHPSDTTSSSDDSRSSLARLRRGGSKVLRLLSSRQSELASKTSQRLTDHDIASRPSPHMYEVRLDSPSPDPSSPESPIPLPHQLGGLEPRDSFEIAKSKVPRVKRSNNDSFKSRDLKPQHVNGDCSPAQGHSGIAPKSSRPELSKRKSSKKILTPSAWLSGRQAGSNLDGSAHEPIDYLDLGLAGFTKPVRHNDGRIGPKRTVSSPNIALQRKMSDAKSTVSRRPQCAAKQPIPIPTKQEDVREPAVQATIHPAKITLSSMTVPVESASKSTSPSSLNNGVWSPVPAAATPQTSIGSSNLSRVTASPASIVVASGYEQSPSLREVHFDLPPIREVPTPEPSSIRKSPRVASPNLMDTVLEHQQLQSSAAIAEQCAATKVFFETLYHNIRAEYNDISARSLRRRKMEDSLAFICSTFAQQAEARKRFEKLESEHLRGLRCMKARRYSLGSGVSLAGYEMVRVLGKGSFGIVSLVREKRQDGVQRPRSRRAGYVYAMKVIKKSEMLRQCQEAHLRIERDFLVKAAERSRWMVPLVASFQDIDHLYLVMEFQIGGDFLNYLMTAKNGIISEDATRFYTAEIILCVEEAHNMKIIHRDIKPDNFLISSSGHLKLSDFGLAFDHQWAHKQSYFTGHRYAMMEKLGVDAVGDAEDKLVHAKSASKPSLDGQVWYNTALSTYNKDFETRFDRRRMARSIVGTSQYMAPEVILGEYYDARCDWWSVGIIMFECLFGFTPFVRDDRQATKQAIVDFRREFPYEVFVQGPQRVSHLAVDLIGHLLTEREGRLCTYRYNANDYRINSRGEYKRATDFDRSSFDYRGRYVYSHDADQLKQHMFFAGVDWKNLHQMTPPFKPSTIHEDSCKYFDTEAEILKDYMSDTMSEIDAGPGPENDINGMDGGEKQTLKSPKLPPKRPRDKLLRDPVVAKTVLQERKKGAFIGYTYRRPKTWSLGNELRLSGEQDFWRGMQWP